MVDVINLPPLPGLPDVYLAAPATLPTGITTALTADAFDVLMALGPQAWGIYKNGVPIVIADTVADLSYNKAYAISDFSVEQGAFQTFDKVEQPFESRIRFVSGGSMAAREALIASVEAIIGDLQTYEIATPEKIYFNANVVREEFRRNTPSLLTLEVSVQEIRLPSVSSSSSSFNPSDPASADPVNVGTVTPQAPTPSQSVAAGTASETVASNFATSVQNFTPVTTPASSGGIGSA